jgi:DNA-binding beta-propeller fold protein YncE
MLSRSKTCTGVVCKWRIATMALVCIGAVSAGPARAQYEGELTAKRRLFPEVGANLRGVRQVGERTYVLSSAGLVVFDAKEHKLFTIGGAAMGGAAPPATKAPAPGSSFVAGFDVDGAGQIFVADPAANTVTVYSADGNKVRSISVNVPLSVAALPDGEVAVSTQRDPHLILVYDKSGHEVRDFGGLEDISNREDLNRYLNSGYLASDAKGNIYYAFTFAPEPTVRVFDRFGFSTQTIEYTEIEAFAAAQTARKEIERQESKGKQPIFRPILTAISVVRDTGEVWIALHNRLLRFDKDGNRKATYQLYTPDGTRLDATTLQITKDRLIIGGDPLGVFEFERPDLKAEQPKD